MANDTLFQDLFGDSTKSLNMNYRQPRFFYGPILGFLLAGLWAKALCKTSRLQSLIEPNSLYQQPISNEHGSSSLWYPIKNPYQQEPILTTTHPIFNLAEQNYAYFGEETAPSNIQPRKQRYSANRSKRKPSRRTSTTTEFYDSYEYSDYYQPPKIKNKRMKPTRSRPARRRSTTTEYSYDYDNYSEVNKDSPEDYSIEVTTERRKKSRPTKPQNNEEDALLEDLPKQVSSTASTTGDSTAATASTTVTTTTTITANNATGGYGPSNGNENISFTYGPPSNMGYYGPPLFSGYGPPSSSGYGPPTAIGNGSYGAPYYSEYAASYQDFYYHPEKHHSFRKSQYIPNSDNPIFGLPSL